MTRLARLLLLPLFLIPACSRQGMEDLEKQYTESFREADHAAAGEAATAMLAMAERKHSKESAEYAASLNKLGLAKFRMNSFSEAEENHELAVRTYETLYGRKHETVARSLSYLSQVYFRQNRIDAAIETGIVSMNIYVVVLGPDHVLTASQMNSVAMMCEHDGRYAQASLLLRRALAALRMNLDSGHHLIGVVSNNLMRLQTVMMRQRKAEAGN